MQLWQVKDIVREHFGRTGFNTNMLTLALDEGRRIIENEGNWWWMKDINNFTLTIDQQEYDIETGGDIVEPDFKDLRWLSYRQSSASVQWEPIEVGSIGKEELDMMYQTDDEGPPEAAALENKTLFIYPPKPQVAYPMRLYFYQWTSNPTSNTSTDDLISRYPMALAYAALIWGYEIELKDMQGAQYWRALLAAEIKKIKRENLKRENMDKISLTPRAGPGNLRHRRLSNIQIYKR